MQKVPVEKRRKRVFCMREIFDLYSYLKISGAQAAGRRLKAREAGIHVPVFLQADISVHCNLSCPGCENGYIHTKHQEELMTVNEWDVLFREAEKLGIRFFFLTGGDPLQKTTTWLPWDFLLSVRSHTRRSEQPHRSGLPDHEPSVPSLPDSHF